MNTKKSITIYNPLQTKEKTRDCVPSPEVSERRQRRRFSAAQKLGILSEADQCNKSGEIGALLRREGIYSTYLTKWRAERAQGAFASMSAKNRGPNCRESHALLSQIEVLEKEKHSLSKRLKQAEAIIDVQKKVSEILGISMDTASQSERS